MIPPGRGPGSGRLPQKRGSEGGSVLMLVPAAVLVLVILGAIAVDSAVVFLAQRELANRTAAAANDIAGMGLGDDDLYRRGEVALSPDRADRQIALVFDAVAPAGFDIISAVAEVNGAEVVVRAKAEVRHLFAPAIPGARRTTTVQSTSRATATGS